jgi:hypothetical protein
MMWTFLQRGREEQSACRIRWPGPARKLRIFTGRTGAAARGAPPRTSVQPEFLRNTGCIDRGNSRRCEAAAQTRTARSLHRRGQSDFRTSERNARMQKTRVLAGIAALLLIPALAMAQKTSYDYDKTANFSGFKTYALKEGTPVGQKLIDDRIVAAIDAALAAKGFTKSESSPDVFVVYHVAFDKQKDISTFSSGYGGGYGAYGWGYGGGWGGGTTSTQVRDILVGTLVIDVADAKNKAMVWRGMGVKEVDTQAKPEKRDKSITNAVNKIFKNYPPKQDKKST